MRFASYCTASNEKATANVRCLLCLPWYRRWAALAALAVAGCAPLPPHAPPPATLLRPALAQVVKKTAAQPGFQAAGPLTADWWKAFNDPQLSRLIQTALQHGPSIKLAQARLREARQAARLAALDTSVRTDGNVSVVREHLSRHGFFPPPLSGSTTNNGNASVSAAYTLDWWGKNRATLAAAIGETRAAQAAAAAARLALGTAVADTYLGLQGARARLILARRIVRKQRAQRDLAAARLRHGLSNALPVRAAAQQLAREQGAARTLRYQAQVYRYRLAALTGHGPDWRLPQHTPPARFDTPFPLPRRLPLDWLGWRPDIAAQRWRVEAAAQRITAARAAFYPNIDLTAMAGLQSIELSRWLTAGSLLASVGPAVHLPFFDHHTLQAKLGQRHAEADAAIDQYNQQVLAAAEQVATRLARLNTLNRQLLLQRAATAAARQAERLNAARFHAGLTDNQPLLAAEINTLGQRQRQRQLENDRLRAIVSLIQALGGGVRGDAERNKGAS